ncbi:MAG: hypothetical protein PHF21_00920 [Bacilli bacterium]|nr:hypothetical protein [Bacilli bacterium]
MNYNPVNFSFASVLSGISKTLGVAKEVIPLWQQTKPLIRNAKTAYTLIKNNNIKKTTFDRNDSINTNSNFKKEEVNNIKEKTIIKSNNSPQFFM